MKIELPENVKKILSRLESAGFSAYAVGGCVRDSLLQKEPKDWDVTTSAKPDQIKRIFTRTIDTGIQHGTVTVLYGKEAYEVTTFRIDGIYEDARHPKEVTFTPDLREDLRRRDFTINAMAYNEKDGLVDIFGGREDLQQGIIRCVGTPRERFTEDALRMLRALRFSAQLGFSIDEATFEAIRELAPTIRKVSAERIQAELVKLVMSDHPEVMRQVYESGLADQFLPEFSTMMKTPQNTPHHKYTVGEHTICAMQNIRADRVLRLTMLLHDVGKPVCRTTDPTGRDHFIGHPQVGARMAREILRRLKFDNETIRRVSAMVAAHDMRPPLEERAVRRAMVKAGPEYFPVLFEVSRADILAQSSYKQKEKLHNVDVHERICREIIRKHQALSRKDLAVTGRDLMAAGMKPGKGLGDVLDRLLDHVLEFPEDNKRERLMELANRFRSE